MSQHFHTHIMCTEEVKCLKLITLDEKNRLFDCGQLGTMALKHLFTQCGIFFTLHIGIRGRDEHQKLGMGVMVLKQDENGEYVVEC